MPGTIEENSWVMMTQTPPLAFEYVKVNKRRRVGKEISNGIVVMVVKIFGPDRRMMQWEEANISNRINASLVWVKMAQEAS